jgi:hypothetical protein
MAELTNEQIEQAVVVFENSGRYAATGELLTMKERMIRAAPFLQLPWDEPIQGEVNGLLDSFDGSYSTRDVVVEFVRLRNAARQPKPKPVDPRREKIIAALDKQFLNGESSKIADAVLEALNEVR